MGLNRDGTFWRIGDFGQPCADDLLLFDSDTADGAGFRHRWTAPKAIYAPAQSHRRMSGGCSDSGISELVESVSYLGIWPGVDA